MSDGAVTERTWRRPSPAFWPEALSESDIAALPDALLLVTAWRERAEAWVLARQGADAVLGQPAAGSRTMVYRLHGLFLYNQVAEAKNIAGVPLMDGAPPWLARLYSLLLRVQEWVNEEEPLPPPRPARAERRAPGGTGGRRTVFGRGYGITSSSRVARALGLATQRGTASVEADGWTAGAGGVLARTVRGGRGAGEDEITVSFSLEGQGRDQPLTVAQQDALAAMAGGMSDLDHDVLDIMLAHHREHRDGEGYTHLAVETILRERGIKPKSTRDSDGRRREAGYRPDDLARHAAAVDRLLHMEVRLHNLEVHQPVSAGTLRRTGERTWRWSFDSPAFEWQRLARPDAAGTAVTREIRYRPTQWQEAFAAQTMRLPRAVLGYEPERQKWEKRIARYLLRQARINVHKGDSTNAYRVAGAGRVTAVRLHRQIGTILRDTNLLSALDRRNPQKGRTRFEKALTRLVHDGVLAGWGYTMEAQETLRTMPRQNWLDDYWVPSTIWADVEEAQEHLPARRH